MRDAYMELDRYKTQKELMEMSLNNTALELQAAQHKIDSEAEKLSKIRDLSFAESTDLERKVIELKAEIELKNSNLLIFEREL